MSDEKYMAVGIFALEQCCSKCGQRLEDEETTKGKQNEGLVSEAMTVTP